MRAFQFVTLRPAPRLNGRDGDRRFPPIPVVPLGTVLKIGNCPCAALRIPGGEDWGSVLMVRRKPEIPVGTRFKLSRLGEARNHRFKSLEGTVVGAGLYKNTLRVVMDGRKSPLSLHRDYIEPIAPDAE